MSDVLVHGSGFDPEFGSGHFRTITLPPMEVLEDRSQAFLLARTWTAISIARSMTKIAPAT